MKKLKLVACSVMLSLFAAQTTQAAIPATATVVTTEAAATAEAATAATTTANTVVKTHKKVSKTKAAIVKKMMNNEEISKGLYIILAILGLGFVGMGINDNWEGSDWIIGLVLSLLFWLPGVIWALIKMKKYY